MKVDNAHLRSKLYKKDPGSLETILVKHCSVLTLQVKDLKTCISVKPINALEATSLRRRSSKEARL